jgi:hypothetical protein
MFHVQLRQFPHNACAFNLSEAELLQTLVIPWSQAQWVSLGERKWNPHQARLTVLEGPHLPVEDLAMGRGWRNAQHQSEDVTERLLARARGSQQPGGAVVAGVPAAAVTAAGDAPAAGLDAQLPSLLGADPDALLGAWRLAARRRPELSPSESLALAEQTLRSLGGEPV